MLQGVMGRVASWFGASTSGRNGSVQSRSQHSSTGVPDFLAQADDPDKRRVDHARAQSRGRHSAPEECSAWVPISVAPALLLAGIQRCQSPC